jgi:predicted aconitase with swiveling domain
MNDVVFSIKRGIGATVTAPILISPRAFSPRYDWDRVAGCFSRPGHPLEGKSFAGKILFFPAVQGGVAGGWVFYELAARGLAPAGVVFGRTNPVQVQGCVLAGIPVADGCDPAAFTALRNDDVVTLDCSAATISRVSCA